MNQFSVTRALAKIKALDGRIAAATSNPLISFEIGGKSAGNRTIAEVEQTIRSNYQSVTAMLVERAKLKSAVVVSNAAVKVTIAGVEMTVAEAIERKTSIQQEQAILQSARQQLAQAVAKVEQNNIAAKTRLDTLIQTAVGKDRKVDEAEVSALTVPFMKQNMANLIDPLNLQQVIEETSKRVSDFLTEVDYVLSESNAVTMIEVA